MEISENDSVFKYNYLYNNDTLIVVETKALKTAGGWLNISQKEWFKQSELPARQVERKWLNNTWQDAYNIDYKLVGGVLTETQSEIKESESAKNIVVETVILNSKKQKITKFIFQNNLPLKESETSYYYSNSQLDSTIAAIYKNGIADSFFKTVYYYNPDSTYNSVIFQTRTPDKSWTNENKSAWYYFNGTKNIRSQRNYSWNNKSNKWENSTKIEFEYNALENIISETASLWKTLFWVSTYRYVFNYNQVGKVEKKQVFYPIYNDWRNTNTVNFITATNSRNLTIESVYGFWGGNAGEKLTSHIAIPFNDETIVRNGHTITLTYAPFVGTNIPVNKGTESKIKVYPNPSHGILYISNFDSATCNWTLSGLNGTILKNSSQHLTTSLVDISDLPNGIYLLNVKSPNENQTRKIVKY